MHRLLIIYLTDITLISLLPFFFLNLLNLLWLVWLGQMYTKEFDDNDKSRQYRVQNSWIERQTLQRADLCFPDSSSFFLLLSKPTEFSNHTALSEHDLYVFPVIFINCLYNRFYLKVLTISILFVLVSCYMF